MKQSMSNCQHECRRHSVPSRSQTVTNHMHLHVTLLVYTVALNKISVSRKCSVQNQSESRIHAKLSGMVARDFSMQELLITHYVENNCKKFSSSNMSVTKQST